MTGEDHLKEEVGGFYLEFTPEKKDTARRQGKSITTSLQVCWLVVKALGGVFVGNNRNGIQSDRFIQHLEASGIKVERVNRGKEVGSSEIIPLIPTSPFNALGYCRGGFFDCSDGDGPRFGKSP